MASLNLPFETAQKLSIAIRNSYFPGYHTLPYNRFSDEHSQHWWISPFPEKAAFPYGKAVISTEDSWVPASQVFCGYNVEKGLVNFQDQMEDKDFGNPNWVMKPNWMWHRFANQPADELNEMLNRADQKTELQTRIIVNCGKLVTGAPWDRVEFLFSNQKLEPISYQSRNQSLEPLSQTTDLAGFQETLRNLSGQDNAWDWIDLYIGSYFQLNSTGPDDLGSCGAMLTTFLPWITVGEETT